MLVLVLMFLFNSSNDVGDVVIAIGCLANIVVVIEQHLDGNTWNFFIFVLIEGLLFVEHSFTLVVVLFVVLVFLLLLFLLSSFLFLFVFVIIFDLVSKRKHSPRECVHFCADAVSFVDAVCLFVFLSFVHFGLTPI